MFARCVPIKATFFSCLKENTETPSQVFGKFWRVSNTCKENTKEGIGKSHVPLATLNSTANQIIYLPFNFTFHSSSHNQFGTFSLLCYFHFLFLFKKEFIWERVCVCVWEREREREVFKRLPDPADIKGKTPSSKARSHIYLFLKRARALPKLEEQKRMYSLPRAWHIVKIKRGHNKWKKIIKKFL